MDFRNNCNQAIDCPQDPTLLLMPLLCSENQHPFRSAQTCFLHMVESMDANMACFSNLMTSTIKEQPAFCVSISNHS